ncbi:MAG: hypothetical protein WBA22_08695 [Candidatus Methanofastidiosia archaeon]
MRWKTFFPRNERIGKILSTVDDFTILPTSIYFLEKQAGEKSDSEKKQELQVEGFYFTDNEKPCVNAIFASRIYFGNEMFHFTISTESLPQNSTTYLEDEEITLTRNLLVRFIVETSMTPFYVCHGRIFISEEASKSIKLDILEPQWTILDQEADLDIEKFLDSFGRENPLLILLDKAEMDFPNYYQNEKFRNAVRALKLIISKGFPYRKVIDLRKATIVNEDLRSKVLEFDEDLGIDGQYLFGNPEKRFCRLVRFCLRKIVEYNNNAIKVIYDMGTPNSSSLAWMISILEDEISRTYIEDLGYGVFDKFGYIHKKEEIATIKDKIICTSFVITMRLSNIRKKEEILEIEREIKKSHMLDGLKYDLNIPESSDREKIRFNITYYGEIDAMTLVETLNEIKTILSRKIDSINTKLKRKDGNFISYKYDYWLRFFEFQIEKPPNLRGFRRLLHDFLIDLSFEREFGNFMNIKRKQMKDRIRLAIGFPQYFDVYVGDYIEKESEYDEYPLLLKKAIKLLLKGNFNKGIALLRDISVVLYLEKAIIEDKNESKLKPLTDKLNYIGKKYMISQELLEPFYNNGRTVLCSDYGDVKKLNEIKDFLISKEAEFRNLYDLKKKTISKLENGEPVISKNIDKCLKEIIMIYQRLNMYSKRDLSFFTKLIDSLYIFMQYLELQAQQEEEEK